MRASFASRANQRRSGLPWGYLTQAVLHSFHFYRSALTAREIHDIIERNWPRSGLDYHSVSKTCSALCSRGILENVGTRKAARYRVLTTKFDRE